MILTQVLAQTLDNATAEFERAIRSILSDTRSLPGCVRSDWFRDPDIPGRYVILGEFESMEHFLAYRRSPVVARIGREILPLLKDKPEFQHYDARLFEQGPVAAHS